ncbi:MAG: HAD family hydrolase [Bacteroidales bacterium]|nr:HAD family hydrolase [Bacteroidales bacterium]
MEECTASTKIIVFDLDDTLYNEVDFVYSGYNAVSQYVAEEYGYTDALKVLKQAFQAHKNPFDELADAMKPKTIDIPKLLEIYRFHKPQLTLSRTAEITLDYLQGEDAILCMITDGRSITQRNKIEALGLNKYFTDDNLIISEEFGVEKTDKRPFQYFMDKYKEAKHFYYIGDNTAKDFFWPNRMRWTTICLEDKGKNIHKQKFDSDKMHNPAIIIDNIYDLPSMILE